MSRELMLSVVLTAYGNAALHSAPGHRTPLPAAHPVLESIHSLQFGEMTAAACHLAASRWLTSLKRRGATRQSLVELAPRKPDGETPPNVLEAFVNGNPRGIVVERPGAMELWVPFWRRGRGQREIVRYSRYRIDDQPDRLSVTTATRKLRKAIETAQAYAARTDGLHFWAKRLEQALEQFRSRDDVDRYLPATGYSLAAKRLLLAASWAWVFGGMGSWNDIGFTDPAEQQEYDDITHRLYRGVCTGILTAANAFRP